MTTFESPRDAHGNRLCEYCGDPVPKSLGTKPKRYCKRSCRQRAYEARQKREAIVTAVATAVARSGTSRDVPERARPTSRDVAKPPVPAADPGDGWVRSIDEVDEQLRELEARRPVVPPAPQQKRRRLAAPPAAEAPTLFGPEAADGE
ncbi:hypothetical protein ACFYQA_38565 [Streptomyces sp. NPDC005774]|uniref:hypothetical protein n=1 Tax=Streptomyces sp. NPDC005774 TaxID=3364728 RepID=UPI0036CAFD84